MARSIRRTDKMMLFVGESVRERLRMLIGFPLRNRGMNRETWSDDQRYVWYYEIVIA